MNGVSQSHVQILNTFFGKQGSTNQQNNLAH